uniref:Uncharacterized protein n=1 Tax=Tanacetum cinerariifolium TaxID=118510 RepID=A0A699HQ14_TANCI|nr:hypothetical protein [Tanacetum cinerariifolium]
MYGAILFDNLTNQSMKESEAYKTYYAFATGKAISKPKYVRRSVKEKTEQVPKASYGKRIKFDAKKSSDDEDDDDDETSVSKEKDDDDQEDDDDQDNDDEQGDDDERTDSDNDGDGDEFFPPKFFPHNVEDKEEDSFDHRVQTPFHVGSTNDEDGDKEIQGVNVEGDKMDEEETNKEDEGDELYRDVNSSSVSSSFVSNMLNPSPDTGIDSIFNLNTESTSLVDVLVTTIVEPPFLSATTLPPPPTPLITYLQQTPVPTPATVPSSSLQDLPNFSSLFGFDHRLKALEYDFSEFKQTN